MTLLAAITNASTTAAAAAGGTSHPIVRTPGAPPPPPTSALPTPIPPSTWTLSPADPALDTAASFLAGSLSACSTVPRFRILLVNFLTTLAQSLSLPTPPANFTDAIRALAPYFPGAVASLFASAAVRLADYEVLLALAECRLLPHPPPDLISSLADSGRADIVCFVLRQAADIRSSEILAALRCFLSPASEEAYDAMVDVKNRWREVAVSAINKCNRQSAEMKVYDVARRAALLLMMGHDGFSSPEVCLHYLLASGNVDSVLLGAAVAELDGDEVVRITRYLNKWIEKFRRFPGAQPCPEASVMLGLEQCDSVPTFGAVARALGVVLDNHFSHLVLNADVREVLRAADVMLKDLAVEAESSGPILDLLRRLQQNK